MSGIFHAAFDEMSFNVLELKFLLEIANNEINIDAVLASVDIGGNEATLWKSVDADMTLGNHENTAPTAGVFYVIIRSRVDLYMRFT